MVMKKKAQAAMEFLMTYGWAILVVLVVIGALAYFGVLNPQNLLPEKCTLPMGLYCKDHLISSAGTGSVSLRLENGMGDGIMIRTISIAGEALTGCDDSDQTAGLYNGITGWHLANGDSNTTIITCTAVADFTGKTKGDITITYCSDSPGGADGDEREDNCANFIHTMEGELLAKVEK